MSDCIFCKIVKGEIPAKKLYEDDEIIAFWDIDPQAPKHFLVVPKKHLAAVAALEEGDERLAGRMLRLGARLAAEHGVGDFRVIFNNGPMAGQEVFHLHMHILGGRQLHGLG
ncbi:MAG: histidine triad nucleotide-binding protein [Desulfobulbaceae bacterium]|jgi:histidine triad (HIT) family protein|nr:histidine triad nucleotide-binding protein [Desulfobulbaceae bacterium]